MKRPLILSVIRYYQNNGVAFECISCYCDLTIFLAPLWQNVQDVYWGCCCLTNSVAEGINPDSFLDFFFVPALSIFQFKERQLYYFEDKLSKKQNPCRIHYFIRFFFKVSLSYIEFDWLRKIQLSLKLRHYEKATKFENIFHFFENT